MTTRKNSYKHDRPKQQKIFYDPAKADVFSIGVLLFLLLNDDFPFLGNGREAEMVELQRDRNYTFYNDHLSGGAQEVLHLHLEPDPQKRPTMDRILAHPWFDERCWADVND